MGFLILDTDRQSTASLRRQLESFANVGVRELSDVAEYARLKKRNRPPPEVIFLDQDGDPERVEGFRQELESAGPASVAIFLGTDRSSSILRSHDSYLRKPVFVPKLERAVLEGYAFGQERRFGIGYIGDGIPSELVRELPHVSRLWRQIFSIDPKDPNLRVLAKTGVLFINMGGGRVPTQEERELIRRFYRVTSASRIMLVGIGNSPRETYELRNQADYFVSLDADWNTVLRALARRRIHRLRSTLALRRARDLLRMGRKSSARRELSRVLRSDPWNLTAHGLLADLSFSLGHYEEAQPIYRRVLDLNPCQPRAYLRLLEIERKIRGRHYPDTLTQALSFCPKVPGIHRFAPDAEKGAGG